MDLDTLFAALVNADKQAEAESPFRGFEDISTAVGNKLVQDAGEYSLGENLIGGLLTGLVGGGARYMTDNYKDQQSGLARDVLGSALTGQAMERPSGMSPSIYSPLRNAGSIYAAQQQTINQSEAAKEARELNKLYAIEGFKQSGAEALERVKHGYDIDKAVLGAKVENPYIAEKIDKVAGRSPSGSIESSLYGAPAPQDIPAPNSIDLSLPILGDVSLRRPPALEDYMDRAMGDVGAAKSFMERDLSKPDREMTLRKEYSQRQEIKDFILADTGFRAMKEAFKDRGGTSDVELTRRAIQAIEPGLAVRQDDQAAIAASSSWPDEWKAFMTGALTGESKLPLPVREGLMRIAQRSYNERVNQFNKLTDFYKQQAIKDQLDPDSISYMEDAEPSKDNFSVLTDLAAKFPKTEEGRAAFKAEAARLGYK